MQETTQNSTLKISRVAGTLILLSLAVPTLNWLFILSQFIAKESNTSNHILNNELMFRFNIVNGIVTTLIIFALAICLFVILKRVNRTLALMAFSLKIIEVVLTAMLTLVLFIAFLVFKGDPENIGLQKVINLFIENYIFLTAIPGIFLGLSMVLFSYLFVKSGYVPKLLASFGIVSYLLVITYDSLTILLPEYASILPIQIIGSLPVCIFQITIGLWLIVGKMKTNTSYAY